MKSMNFNDTNNKLLYVPPNGTHYSSPSIYWHVSLCFSKWIVITSLNDINW
jgi:hypothetical protein